MPRLFGAEFSKEQILKRVGQMSQVCGVRPVTLADGPEAGVRAADFRTGTGFSFTVLIDRGMDVSWAEYCGKSLAWHSASAQTHPAYYEPEGLGWLRGFYGGLVVTCGLTYAGAPCVDEGKPLGLHGRASNTPALHVCVGEEWQGDEYVMWVSGEVHETVIFGEKVCLTRRISAKLGESRFFLHDRVENRGFAPVEHMILYHINGGFPAIDEGASLVAPTITATPRDAEAENEKDKFAQFSAPIVGFKERCYYHDMASAPDGTVKAALINRSCDGGFGFYVQYNKNELPCFTEWKMMGAGDYVVGMEPANCLVEGRDKERKRGTLQFLQPGEVRDYHLEIGILDGPVEIAAFDDWVRKTRQAA